MQHYRTALTAIAVYAALFSASAFALVRDLNIVNKVITPDGIAREYVISAYHSLTWLTTNLSSQLLVQFSLRAYFLDPS